MNGVRVSPAPSGCTCPPSGGFGSDRLHFTTYAGCDLNKTPVCDHAHAHRLMQRCGFCGWVDPRVVAVPLEQLQRLLQHVQRTRPCCREAAAPIQDLVDRALAAAAELDVAQVAVMSDRRGLGDCVSRDGEIVCDDDLCHGVDQTLCGLARGFDFDTAPTDDHDQAGNAADEFLDTFTVPVRDDLL